LFQISLAQLRLSSEAFHELFGIPQDASSPVGREEGHPIRLEGVSADEFTSFLDWLYHIPGASDVFDEAKLLNILKFSHMWICDGAKQFAMNGLNALNLPPSRKLEIGISFGLRDWIASSINTLVLTPLALGRLNENER
ncbi:hypothetical protein BDN72DRAFT_748655, partial [Pluteus cervinus]